MSVDLQRLIHLEAVYRLGSFSQAAEELGRTQPTISRSIAYLEARWGVRLFDREPGGVVPTKVGMDLIRDVERLLAQVKVIDHNMGVRAKGSGGSVDFGMAPLVGAIVTAKALSETFRSSPALTMKVRVEPLADLIGHLKKGTIDFAIFSETLCPDEPELHFDEIGEIPLKIIVRKDHPMSGVAKPGLEQLADYPAAATTYMRELDFLPQPSIICDNYAIIRDLVLRSDFVWYTSPLIFRTEIDGGQVVVINLLDDGLPEVTRIFVAHKKGKLSSPASQNVLNEVINALNLVSRTDI